MRAKGADAIERHLLAGVQHQDAPDVDREGEPRADQVDLRAHAVVPQPDDDKLAAGARGHGGVLVRPQVVLCVARSEERRAHPVGNDAVPIVPATDQWRRLKQVRLALLFVLGHASARDH